MINKKGPKVKYESSNDPCRNINLFNIKMNTIRFQFVSRFFSVRPFFFIYYRILYKIDLNVSSWVILKNVILNVFLWNLKWWNQTTDIDEVSFVYVIVNVDLHQILLIISLWRCDINMLPDPLLKSGMTMLLKVANKILM